MLLPALHINYTQHLGHTDDSRSGVKMFFTVVILVITATCCTARMLDYTDLQSPWEQSGKFEGDIMLNDEQRHELFNPLGPRTNNEDPLVTDIVFNDTDLQSAWEQSGKYEGDIMLNEEQLRTGVIRSASRWPNSRVPFVISNVFNSRERNQIVQAMQDFHRRTPVRFTQFNSWSDRNFIEITGQNSGCWSFVGRQGRRQQLNLQRNGCMRHGIIIHELLHAVGFFHMHSAPERDDYVTINWDNIERGRENNFLLLRENTVSSFGVPYDYDSVMHYGPFAFSRNGLRTIVPRDPNARIGQIDGFSEKDILRVQRMHENSSYATRPQFITIIIITLSVLTHLQ